MPSTDFLAACASVAEALADARDDWWVIGSATVALHGGDPSTAADIDVIVSQRDIDALYRRLPLADAPDASKAIFRSQRFGLWSEPALPVEFMTGLDVLLDGRWHSVQPHPRQSIDCGGHEVFVPERGELVAILQSFGRPKDLLRAEALGRV